MKTYWILKGIKILVIAALFLTLIGWVVMFLWNALLPEIFGLPTITFWQAAGLLALSRILFGNMKGGGGHWKHHHAHNYGGWKGHWKEKWEAKWANMTPEEQQRLRERFRSKCGMSPFPPDSTHFGDGKAAE